MADDSATFRALLRQILSRAPDVEVVAEAADGEEAVARTLAVRPDVITMDARMPRLSGLDALTEIMRTAPTPVVVVSADGEEQGLAFRALQLGAVEVVGKPRGGPAERQRRAEAIRVAVQAVAGLTLVGRRAQAAAQRRLPLARLETGAVKAVGIAASTGGPAVLARILSELPAGFPAPILVVQHIAPGFEEGLVHWLGGETRLRVKVAEAGDPLLSGAVLVAPAHRHLAVSGGRVRLDSRPPVKGLRPSGTVLFEALAGEFGAAAAGIILSGMGDDGVAGLRALRARGSYTAAQGPETCVVYGMPRVAIETGAAGQVLEADEVAPLLRRLVGTEP